MKRLLQIFACYVIWACLFTCAHCSQRNGLQGNYLKRKETEHHPHHLQASNSYKKSSTIMMTNLRKFPGNFLRKWQTSQIQKKVKGHTINSYGEILHKNRGKILFGCLVVSESLPILSTCFPKSIQSNGIFHSIIMASQLFEKLNGLFNG